MEEVRAGRGTGTWYFQILLELSKMMNKDQGQEEERYNPPGPYVMNKKLIELSNTGFLLRSLCILINQHFPSCAIFF